MIRTVAVGVSVFALLVTTPANAAYVSSLDANIDLQFGPSLELTGTIDLTLNTYGGAAHGYPWFFTGDLSLNGTPITPINVSLPGILALYSVPTSSIDEFVVNTSYLPPDPTYQYFEFGPLFSPTPATGGTVTVLSETTATPLPDALPMFGGAIIALGGFAAWRSRRAERG